MGWNGSLYSEEAYLWVRDLSKRNAAQVLKRSLTYYQGYNLEKGNQHFKKGGFAGLSPEGPHQCDCAGEGINWYLQGL